jgi:hypothetical protein
MGVTRRYHVMATGFAVWADYPNRQSKLEVHVGKLWMVAGVGRRPCITVSVDGRGVKVEEWRK